MEIYQVTFYLIVKADIISVKIEHVQNAYLHDFYSL